MERYLRVNLLGPDPRLMKKEFTGPRSHKGRETLVYTGVPKHSCVAMLSPISVPDFEIQEWKGDSQFGSRETVHRHSPV